MTANKAPTQELTARALGFAMLVAKGKTQTEAYRAFYSPRMNEKSARERASKLASDPRVAAEIKKIQGATQAHVLLSVNDRLTILATDARLKGNTPAHASARARIIKVYNELAGDQAPERHDITVSAPDGGPVQVAVSAAVTIQRVPVRRRVEALKAARTKE